MINIGVIGFGKMGRIRAKAIAASGRGQIRSVYDPGPSGDCAKFAFTGSVDAIFNDPQIEAIFICTPNRFNKEYTVRALEAGKHVFCEKPPAFTEPELDGVAAAVLRTGKKLMYGFNHRHHASIKHMKSLIDSLEYGRVLWMRGRYGKSADRHFYSDWRSKKELAGGGIFLDQGIHMLDLFLHLGDDFDEVKAFVSNLFWKLDIEDNVFAMFRNSRTGMAASLHSTMTQWRHLFSLEVFLEKGYMVLNGLKTSSGTYGDEVLSVAKNRSTAPASTWEDEERTTYHTEGFWRSEIDHFMDAVIDGKPVAIGNLQDARKLMRLVDRVYADGRQKG